ncbi:17-beta-hydroxysteroid dehydrogenase-like protein Ecym_5128 [Eremothecium cymbalariae DBVPG|uniref:Uncharacterized protein n=1 Tax=Eremothecium cymbalariae (strain CBS 270.75 / DBVPG 7215 / KCTC 17166 / NRRL Y-17582) TaxID=931890 RepID=I6NCW5_ERECY|nr:hypothetical protein Ecym_5128 [Eremothecium cymbalariae DBVPG\
MLHKLKGAFGKKGNGRKVSLPDLPPPGEVDRYLIYQNRRNVGVNFGSLFVLEKYIFDSLFEYGGEAEKEAVENQVEHDGVDGAAEKLRSHYEKYVTRIDWRWLSEDVGVTTIRLPIGYWHVDNGMFVDGTPFEKNRKVYSKANSWDFVRAIFEEAGKYDIGILIDLHGLPGGANNESHSGGTGKMRFFNNYKYMDYVCNTIIPFIVQDLSPYGNFAGLQVVNEAMFDNEAKGQKYYYSKAIAAIREHNPTLPVVISDGWWHSQWANWLEEEGLDNNVILDTHVYRCFSEEDRSKDARQIIQELKSTVKLEKEKVDTMIGEFSCVLDTQTWDKTDGDRNELVREYGQEEIRVFNSQSNFGWFFWTYQFEHGDGGEWGFVPMVNSGSIPKRSREPLVVDENRVNQIVTDHIDYWSDKNPEKMEHWRFEEGLRMTIKDIQNFDSFNNSRIGRVNFWNSVRRAQHIHKHGTSKWLWEWDEGFRTAINQFNN